MTHPLLRAALTAALFALAGCAGPIEPYFSSVTIAPVRGGLARIYFYRELEPYESLARPSLYLNGRVAGRSIPGGVFYRDVTPGVYDIAVDTVGLYWTPFKTVTLDSGDTLYVKIESLSSWQSGGGHGDYRADTFVVAIIPPDRAPSELADKRYLARESG